MDVKVIGSGCENCDKTNAVVKECLEELGMDTEIERVTMANKFHDLDEPINRIGTDSFKWD